MDEITLEPIPIGEIIEKIDEAISELLKNELENLKRGIKEENISGYLTLYLRPSFSQYNVDPEYNGDIEKNKDRKALEIAENRIKAVKKRFMTTTYINLLLT